MNHSRRIAFFGTRFQGTDGVSEETARIAGVLQEKPRNHQCFYFAGRLSEANQKVGMTVDEAFFGHPAIAEIHRKAFVTYEAGGLHVQIQEMAAHLLDRIREFDARFEPDLYFPQNALAAPMNIPLAVAFTIFQRETMKPCVNHLHDLWWERTRYRRNCVQEYLDAYFPPDLDFTEHVTLLRRAQRSLAKEKGLSSTILPNCRPFGEEELPDDDYPLKFRERVGIPIDSREHLLVVQPTRVVPRKGFQHSIRLVGYLKSMFRKTPITLIGTHAAGDEGLEYKARIQKLAEDEQVDLQFVDDLVGPTRMESPGGHVSVFSVGDAIRAADFVTCPSKIEGQGNNILDTFLYRKSLMVNRFDAWAEDLAHRGFKVVEIDDLVTRETAEQVRDLIRDPQLRQEMTDTNYQVAERHFSLKVLRRKVDGLLQNLFGTDGFCPTCGLAM